MATTSSLMTAEELLALPDDGIDRELIRGELREYPMTTRSTPHCLAMTNLAMLLGVWLERQPEPRGKAVHRRYPGPSASQSGLLRGG